MVPAVLALIAPKPWTLVAGGDIMFYGIGAKTSPLKEVAATFQKADLSYGNLEIPLTSSKTPTRRKSAEEIKAKHQFILKAEPSHIGNLKGTFDLVSLANNHAMDYGTQGITETINLLNKAGIQHAGAGMNIYDATTPTIKTLPNGIRVGMISYLAFVSTGGLWKCTPATAKTSGLAGLDLGGNPQSDRVQDIVRAAKKKCDVLLVALHWGIERQTKPTKYQINLGRNFIRSGADVVLGAHPHRLQGREIYKGKPILYSMGNLISPLPAATAVYTLNFDGTKFKSWDLRPMRNTAGKAKWYSTKEEPAVKRQILALDKLIR